MAFSLQARNREAKDVLPTDKRQNGIYSLAEIENQLKVAAQHYSSLQKFKHWACASPTFQMLHF